MKTLAIHIFASPVYWKDESLLNAFYRNLTQEISDRLTLPEGECLFSLVCDASSLPADSGGEKQDAALFLPLSGGVQPLMLKAAERYAHVGVVNGYLEGFLPPSLAERIMYLNGHPSCTDFYAFLRQAGRSVFWLSSWEGLDAFLRGYKAATALKEAVLLKVGETEPWVINSQRDPVLYKERLGVTVLPVESQILYDRMASLPDESVREMAEDFREGSAALIGIDEKALLDASRAVRAIKDLLDEKGASGLSMACFSMIPAVNTTSCLALSYLNDLPGITGACEGDLEAAVTQYLIKAAGGSFGWIANPIIYDDDYLDLAHCTAPRCLGNRRLDYSLLRHHESGKGVATEVDLPGDERVTLVRIGGGLRKISCFTGRTEKIGKQGTCHTQIRVRIPSSERFTKALMGTHQVLCYGDISPSIGYAAAFLGLELID